MLSQTLINQIDQLRDTFSAKGAEEIRRIELRSESPPMDRGRLCSSDPIGQSGPVEINEKTPILVAAQSDAVRISVEVIDCDRLGYLLTSLGAQQLNDQRDGGVIDKVQIEEQIGMLVGRITYLTEALTLIEKAPNLSHVLIRSANPDKRADGIYYYELTLEGGKFIRLNRRCYNFQTRRRSVVPFTLARSVFERLVEDVEDILNDDECGVDLPSRFEAYPSIW